MRVASPIQCQAEKDIIEARMKQLRSMINSDFDNMVDFGKKVSTLQSLLLIIFDLLL